MDKNLPAEELKDSPTSLVEDSLIQFGYSTLAQLSGILKSLSIHQELTRTIAGNKQPSQLWAKLAQNALEYFEGSTVISLYHNNSRNAEVKAVITRETGIDTNFEAVPWHLLIRDLDSRPKAISSDEIESDIGVFLKSIASTHCLLLPITSLSNKLVTLIVGFPEAKSLSDDKHPSTYDFTTAASAVIAHIEVCEQLESAKIEADQEREANISKSRFIANMSHELRTPLTAILGYSQVVRDGTFGPLNDKQTDAISSIINSSQHLKQLMDEVLNLARIESGKEVAQPEEVVLGELLQHCHKLMLQQAFSKGVSLEPLDLDSKVFRAKVEVDPKHAKQIILNLLSNAIKYTPEGGSASLSAELIEGRAKIIVSDNGVGISEEKLKTIFKRFERGKDIYSKQQEGTGLGLNLARKLIRLNEGSIGVESTLGSGSTFAVTLPLSSKRLPSTSFSISNEKKRVQLPGYNAIVVDDNTDTCTVLAHILRSAGMEVVQANRVKDAIKAFFESAPHVILTDLAMPGESGIDLINQVRSSGQEASNLPILVLSACAFDSDREAAMKAGASAFLAKPFKPDEVLKKVKELIAD